MSYGGIDRVEVDEEYGYYYVYRDAGYINRYSIEHDAGFLEWCEYYYESGDLDMYRLKPEEPEDLEKSFSDWSW